MPLPILAVAGLVKAGIGLAQVIGGATSKSKEKHRPKYEIPGEYERNIALARDIKNLGMPAEQYNASRNAINRNLSSGMSMFGGRRGALSNVATLLRVSDDAALDLESRAAQMRQQNLRMGTQLEMNANMALAGQKLQKQNWEKFQGFLGKQRRAQAAIGAGIQNVAGGIMDYAMGKSGKGGAQGGAIWGTGN